MKNTLFTTLFLLLFFSCKKEEMTEMQSSSQGTDIIQKQSKYLSNVKVFLKESLSKDDYAGLNFNKINTIKFDSGKIYLLRIQLNKAGNEFILLTTDTLGNCTKGMIVNIEDSKKQTKDISNKSSNPFNGNIIKTSLDRKITNSIKIINGYKEQSKTSKEDVIPEDNLLSVIVTAYIYSNGTINYADWFNLLDLFAPYDFGIYNYGYEQYGDPLFSYYTPVNPDYSGSGRYIPEDKPKEVSYEYVENRPAIEVDDYLKCFDNIPDAGATCSIEIFTDLPVNGNPYNFFNWENGSPGHTFLQIKKSNGSQSVQQNIGFYPDQSWKTILTPAPVTGKFADNADHEFNASFKMNLSPEQLQSVITEIEYLAKFVKYDIDEYNCTDFALQVFNIVRTGNALEIPKYNIPGGMAPFGTNTPHGLYQALLGKLEDNTEWVNVTLPGVAGWVGESAGPCY